jgi:TolB protein
MNARTAYALFAAAALVLAASLPHIGADPQEPPPPAPAPEQQPDDVTLELRRDQAQQLRLAMPAFRLTPGMSREAVRAARELEATVRQDLTFSGYFVLQGPEAFTGLRLTGDPAQDAEQYRSLGSQILLVGDVREEEGRVVFEGRLFDLASGRAILAKRYRGAFTAARRIGHTFADEVIAYLLGGRGIGLTSIAFASTRTGHKEIFVMDYDGANQRRITSHRSTSMSPAFSPQGGTIAYTSFVNGPPGIYLADLSSGRKRPVVVSGSLNISPSFAPDGGRIAFSRSVEGNVDIYTAETGGGGQRRLTHSAAIDTNPAWSPKGGQIAFTSGRAGNPHLYLMDSEGANQRRLTFEGTYNDGAAWSPEGDLIAYASRRDGRFQIAVTNIVTLATRVLTSGAGENESPSFSPDGRKIVFSSRRSGVKQLWVMDVEGGNLRQLTTEGSNDMADWSRLP